MNLTATCDVCKIEGEGNFTNDPDACVVDILATKLDMVGVSGQIWLPKGWRYEGMVRCGACTEQLVISQISES